MRQLRELEPRDDLQTTALSLIDLLSFESDISSDEFGVHGSLALSMHTSKSDIDLVVYGAGNFRTLEATIDRLASAGTLNYRFGNSLDAARRYRGRYLNKIFMYNAVRRPEEIKQKYGKLRYTALGPVTFTCKVKDDDEAMFRPAIYRIEDCDPGTGGWALHEGTVPETVVSMIGCYRNVARQGDKLRVSGMLERVENVETGQYSHQVVVGTGTSEEERIWPL